MNGNQCAFFSEEAHNIAILKPFDLLEEEEKLFELFSFNSIEICLMGICVKCLLSDVSVYYMCEICG